MTRVRGTGPARRGVARHARGVSLVELVAVLVIVGVVASFGTRLFVQPATSLMASGRNAELGEQAAQALRRLEDDLGSALANSVRVTVGTAGGTPATFVELVPVQTVGRYRKHRASSGPPGDPLDVDDPADASFDVLGPLDAFAAGSSLVIHNLGNADADVYVGNNRRAGAVLSGATLGFTPGGAFPVDSPSGRFAIVGSPVTWICRPQADGGGTLERVTGYAIQAAQPASDAAAPLAGAASRMVAARGVAECAIVQDAAQVNLGLLRLTMALAQGEASVRIAQQYPLDNTP